MDTVGKGYITAKDILSKFDVSKDKLFASGKKSREEVLSEFMGGFESLKVGRDGKISL
jgi:hypothetical protein